jgi:hypothetical protein
MSKTVVIAIDPKMDNFATLGTALEFPLSDDSRVRVLIHNDPRLSHTFHGSVPNFDLLIDGGYSKTPWSDLLEPGQYIGLKRYPKDVQGVLLRRFNKNYGSKTNFENVPAWAVGWGKRNYPDATGWLVIKPLDGARGIGHFVLDSHYINLDFFLKRLDWIVEQAANKKLEDDAFNKFLEDFGEHVEYHSSGDREKYEGLVALHQQGYLVQSRVQFVEKEFRVLTDFEGKPVYFQERQVRKTDDEPTGSKYTQATGGGVRIEHSNICDDADKWFVDHPEVDREYFERLCSEVIGPMSSIDLFFTIGGRWGIFEYCNQFGISGVPADIARALHLQFIVMKMHEWHDEPVADVWTSLHGVNGWYGAVGGRHESR